MIWEVGMTDRSPEARLRQLMGETLEASKEQ